MRFLADVNIAQEVIKFLRRSNHDVLDIKSSSLQATDTQIIQLALKEKRIIITHDRDFETLTQFPKYQVGTILIRLTKQNAKHFCERIGDLLKDKTEEALNNSLTIVTEESIQSYPFIS